MNLNLSFINSSTLDYFPFGMRMWERSSNSSTYRYGYQGSELDDEIKGEGNSYTTHFRLLDPRIGRWLTVDPKATSLSWQSPYTSMDNNPILQNDKNGDCSICDHLYSMGILLNRGMLSSDRFIKTGNLSRSSVKYSTSPNKIVRKGFEYASEGFEVSINEVTQVRTTSTIEWNKNKNEVAIIKVTTSTTVVLRGTDYYTTKNVKTQQLKLGVEKGDLPYNKDTYYLDFEFPVIDELIETNENYEINFDEVDADMVNEVTKALEYNKEAIVNDLNYLDGLQQENDIENTYELPSPSSGDVPASKKKSK